jgi:hypothetical protein
MPRAAFRHNFALTLGAQRNGIKPDGHGLGWNSVSTSPNSK